MAAHLYIHALYEVYTYSNLISAACTSSIHCVRTTHDPGYVVWFIRPVIIRVKGNYPCATSAAIFDPQNPCNCGGVFTLSMRHRSEIWSKSNLKFALNNVIVVRCNLLSFGVNFDKILLCKNIQKRIICIYNNDIAAARIELRSSSTNAKYPENSITFCVQSK